MGQLQGKVCVITGGAGSIGRETAALFLDEGARVMLVDLKEDDLKRAACGLDPQRTATTVADVTRSADVQAYVARTVEIWGRIHVLFSNAGNLGVVRPLAAYPDEVFDSVLPVHVRGAFLACKHGIAAMNDGGSVIITSSVAGVRGDAGVYGYITAKHAQVGLMRAVAKEAAARNIRVNTLHPGPVHNDFMAAVERELSPLMGRDAAGFFNEQIPLRRHARPREIARAALYLASDQSSFTTGSTLMVDGGMSA
jgi:NAD(P)-dependent dehydrogenase (short-subunit alcohol dehydrogenase family)